MTLQTSGTNSEMVDSCMRKEYMRLLNDSPVARNLNVTDSLSRAEIAFLMSVSCFVMKGDTKLSNLLKVF